MNKYIYPFSIISSFSHFLLIYFASIISTFELGIFSLINSIFVILIPTARFDGSFLYISKLISKEDLNTWSKRTNGILTLILSITSLILFINSKFIALALVLLNFLNLYLMWYLELKDPEKRLIKGYNYYFKKDVLVNQISFRFTLQILLILILINAPQISQEKFYLSLKLFILLEILILYSLSIYKIGINLNFSKDSFPPLKFFINILLRKAEGSILNFSIALISGINTLGSIQIAISLSRILQLFVNLSLRLEYVNLFSKKFVNKVLNLSIFSYLIYLLFPMIFVLIDNQFNLLDYKLDPVIFTLLCIYSGNKNTKNIIQHLGIVFKDINMIIRFSLNLIIINFFLVLSLLIIKNIFILSLDYILLILISADLLYTILILYNNYKLNHSR
tara:strand:- start:429 stop:1604 length:1176 start_codon:yes stop_codon:yes gene_type:complete